MMTCSATLIFCDSPTRFILFQTPGVQGSTSFKIVDQFVSNGPDPRLGQSWPSYINFEDWDGSPSKKLYRVASDGQSCEVISIFLLDLTCDSCVILEESDAYKCCLLVTTPVDFSYGSLLCAQLSRLGSSREDIVSDSRFQSQTKHSVSARCVSRVADTSCLHNNAQHVYPFGLDSCRHA